MRSSANPTAKQLELAPKKTEFLAALERVGNISLAARETGIKYTQGQSWARSAGVANIRQDRSAKQTQYTRLREHGATQKAAAAAVGVNRRTGYDWDQTARKSKTQAGTSEDAIIAYKYSVTTAFVEPDGMIEPATQASSAPSVAPVLTVVPAPMQEPGKAPEPPAEAEPSKVPLQLVASASVSIEDLEQVLDARYLSHPERELIADLLRAGQGIRAISRELGRSPSSISREIIRNSHPRLGYQPHGAQRTATKARARPKPSKLATHGPLREYVKAKLKLCWSPSASVPCADQGIPR